jgi:hypothetical protein
MNALWQRDKNNCLVGLPAACFGNQVEAVEGGSRCKRMKQVSFVLG